MLAERIQANLFTPRVSETGSTRHLRTARTEDISALRRLIEQSVRGLSQQAYTPQQIDSSLKYIFGVDTQLIADNTYYVVEIDRHIVGAGGWSQRKTLYGGDQAKAPTADDLLDPTQDPAKIRAFYVHPAWARQGIGRQLMQACEVAAHAAGFKMMALMATLPGRPLYAACGFEPVEPVNIEMPDGVLLPCVKMVKPLRQSSL